MRLLGSLEGTPAELIRAGPYARFTVRRDSLQTENAGEIPGRPLRGLGMTEGGAWIAAKAHIENVGGDPRTAIRTSDLQVDIEEVKSMMDILDQSAGKSIALR